MEKYQFKGSKTLKNERAATWKRKEERSPKDLSLATQGKEEG